MSKAENYLDTILEKEDEPKKESEEVEIEAWDYDVWGNEEDGYDVNDRFKIETRKIPAAQWKEALDNEEKMTALVKDMLRMKDSLKASDLDFDGDDVTVYVNQASNGYPLGELIKV